MEVWGGGAPGHGGVWNEMILKVFSKPFYDWSYDKACIQGEAVNEDYLISSVVDLYSKHTCTFYGQWDCSSQEWICLMITIGEFTKILSSLSPLRRMVIVRWKVVRTWLCPFIMMNEFHSPTNDTGSVLVWAFGAPIKLENIFSSSSCSHTFSKQLFKVNASARMKFYIPFILHLKICLEHSK